MSIKRYCKEREMWIEETFLEGITITTSPISANSWTPANAYRVVAYNLRKWLKRAYIAIVRVLE